MIINLPSAKGTVVIDGHDAVLFAYGPVMLNEAMVAAETLQEQNFSLKVINLPWLNRIDEDWFKKEHRRLRHGLCFR